MKTFVINHASGRPLDFAAVEKPFVTPALLAAYCAPSYCSQPARDFAEDFAAAARDVLANWEAGNLAHAVQMLARVLGDYEQSEGGAK